MKEIKKKINSFPIIATIILFFFSTILFLSIPVLYNYKSIEKEIEKIFYNDFKIKLTILGDLKYNFFPKPHLVIKKAILELNNENDQTTDIETSNLKIFVPIKNVYSKSDVKISEIEITNTNFNFKIEDFKEFREHLYYKISKPITIKKSKIFYFDKKNIVNVISPIYDLNYFIDKKKKFKQLKIVGNIFNTEYSSSWKRYFESPRKSKNQIVFKNPNLSIETLLKLKENSNYDGNILIKFLDENINFDYSVYGDKINVKSTDRQNQKIKIISNIDLNPFYFDTRITFLNKDFEFIIDNILKFLLNIDKELIGNINGKLTLDFKKLDDEIINSGKINLIVNEKSIKVLDSLFEIENVGIINSKYDFHEKLGEIIFKSKNVLKITNKNEFAKKFQLNSNKIKEINKIYFEIEKNIDNDQISISNIYINNFNQENIKQEFTIIKNIQVLKSFLAKNFN